MSPDVWPGEGVAPNINLAMLDLLECACSAVTARGQGKPCFCGVYPGERVSWEYCSEGECTDGCGMVYIRPSTSFPYTEFPIQDTSGGCTGPMAYEIELGVVRCFQTMNDQGELPSATDVTAAAMRLGEDQNALLMALNCCQSPYLKTKAVAEWTPTGPSGNCVGGFWRVILDPQPY